jgi:zinc/manganese transport system permease protein
LLVFALLVAPAATAQVLTVRPLISLALTIVLGLLIVWLGMGIAYFSVYPAGFYISAIAFGLYVLARLSVAVRARRARAGALGAPAPPAVGVPA